MGERNINFMTVAATNADIQAAIFDAEGVEGPWQPARRQNGEVREGSAVAELTSLVDLGLAVRVAITETQENTGEVTEVAAPLADAGVPAQSFVVRPLLRRALSDTGLDITETSTVPELTVAADGLYWHPAGADRLSSADMRIAEPDCSLAHSRQLVVQRFLAARLRDGSMPRPYRCAV